MKGAIASVLTLGWHKKNMQSLVCTNINKKMHVSVNSNNTMSFATLLCPKMVA